MHSSGLKSGHEAAIRQKFSRREVLMEALLWTRTRSCRKQNRLWRGGLDARDNSLASHSLLADFIGRVHWCRQRQWWVAAYRTRSSKDITVCGCLFARFIRHTALHLKFVKKSNVVLKLAPCLSRTRLPRAVWYPTRCRFTALFVTKCDSKVIFSRMVTDLASATLSPFDGQQPNMARACEHAWKRH